jgi:GTP cyclohydrolase I
MRPCHTNFNLNRTKQGMNDDEEDISVVTNSPIVVAAASTCGGTSSQRHSLRDDEEEEYPSPVPPPASRGGAVCPKRAQGQVCICTLCEAARLRLLDRASKSDPNESSTVANRGSGQQVSFSISNTATTTTIGSADVVGAAVRPLKRLRQQQQEEAEYLESGATVATLSTAIGEDDSQLSDREGKVQSMTLACRTILECIGEDPSREGLQKTPERWAKALLYMCQGYHQSPADVTNGAVFQENHNEMVVVRNIDIHSLWYVCCCCCCCCHGFWYRYWLLIHHYFSGTKVSTTWFPLAAWSTLGIFPMDKSLVCPSSPALPKSMPVVSRSRNVSPDKSPTPLSTRSNPWAWRSSWNVVTFVWSCGGYRKRRRRPPPVPSVVASKQIPKRGPNSLALLMEEDASPVIDRQICFLKSLLAKHPSSRNDEMFLEVNDYIAIMLLFDICNCSA